MESVTNIKKKCNKNCGIDGVTFSDTKLVLGRSSPLTMIHGHGKNMTLTVSKTCRTRDTRFRGYHPKVPNIESRVPVSPYPCNIGQLYILYACITLHWLRI